MPIGWHIVFFVGRLLATASSTPPLIAMLLVMVMLFAHAVILLPNIHVYPAVVSRSGGNICVTRRRQMCLDVTQAILPRLAHRHPLPILVSSHVFPTQRTVCWFCFLIDRLRVTPQSTLHIIPHILVFQHTICNNYVCIVAGLHWLISHRILVPQPHEIASPAAVNQF